MFTVTRQIQWPDGDKVVEVSQGGLDYCNPDALCERYAGELQEYDDPRIAVDVAIEIAKEWNRDSKEPVLISMGCTWGYTIPFEGMELSKETFKLLQNNAEVIYQRMPKCDYCGELIGKNKYTNHGWTESVYCSEYCAEKDWQEMNEYVEEEGE